MWFSLLPSFSLREPLQFHADSFSHITRSPCGYHSFSCLLKYSRGVSLVPVFNFKQLSHCFYSPFSSCNVCSLFCTTLCFTALSSMSFLYVPHSIVISIRLKLTIRFLIASHIFPLTMSFTFVPGVSCSVLISHLNLNLPSSRHDNINITPESVATLLITF